MTPEQEAAILARLDGMAANIAELYRRLDALESNQSPHPVPPPPPPPTYYNPTPEPPVFPEPSPFPEPPPYPEPVLTPQPEPAPALESTVGLNWLNRIGVITLVLGVAFLFKYAVDNEWIGPIGRIALGILAGFATLAAGEFTARRDQRIFAQGVTALGISILYLSFYAAYGFYHLTAIQVSFAAMALTTALAGLLAIRYTAVAISLLALLGGLLTPIVLSTGQDRPWILFPYLTLLCAGAAWLERRQSWKLSSTLALAGSALIYAAWFEDRFSSGDRAPAIFFPLALYALFSTSFLQPVLQVAAPVALGFVFHPADNPQSLLYFSLLLALSAAGLLLRQPLPTPPPGTDETVPQEAQRPEWTVPSVPSSPPAVPPPGTDQTVPQGAQRPEWTVPSAPSPLPTLAGFWLSYTAAFQPQRAQDELLLHFAAITLFFAIAFASTLRDLIASTESEPSDQSLQLLPLAINPVAYYAAGYQLLHTAHAGWAGLFTVAVAACFAFSATLLRRHNRTNATLVSIVIAISFLTLAAPVQLSAWRITLAWVVEAAALAFIARRLNSSRTTFLAALVLILVAARLIAVDSLLSTDATLLNPRFFVFAFAAAAYFFSAWCFPRSALAAATYIAAHITLLSALQLENIDHCQRAFNPGFASSYALVGASIIAAAYGFSLIALGVLRRFRLDRLLGLLTLAAVVAKLYLYDVWMLGRLFRTVAFVALGILLVSASYLYSRYRSRLASLLEEE